MIFAVGLILDDKYFGIGEYLASQAEETGKTRVSAGVLTNPVSSLLKRLKERELALNKREADLGEGVSRFEEKLGMQTKIAITLIVISGALIVLVLLNFYFDWKRKKWEERQHKKDENPT